MKISNNNGTEFEGKVTTSKTLVNGEWENLLVIVPETEQSRQVFDSSSISVETGEYIQMYGGCRYHSKKGQAIWLTYQTMNSIVNYDALDPAYQDAIAALQTLGIETEAKSND